MTQTLNGTGEQEVVLSEKIKANEVLLANAAAAHDAFRETMEHWTEGLVNVATAIDGELAQQGMEDLGYSSDEHLQPSAKLSLLFNGVATTLQ